MGIIPYMIKKHWITVSFDEHSNVNHVPTGEVQRLIDNSYALVVSKMSKKDQ